MAKLRVLTVGKGGPTWAEAAVRDYARRLERLGGVEERTVKPERFGGDVEAVRRAEAARLLQAVGPRDRLVALDERGEDLDTHAFAALVTDGVAQGTGLVFALGGPYGHGPELRERADRVVRLSALVLNHEVARVVLYEQLYRAATLREGLPYHH